jgi:hypothetical protein
VANEMLADECWEWGGTRDKDGYGFRSLGVWINRRAHRLAWAWANGMWHRNGGDTAIPAGMFVLHSCDNPPCCNPAHLRLGTHEENMREKIRKRRDVNSKKTHCPQGHEYSGINLYVNPRTGYRGCRACHKASHKRYRKSRG